MTGKSILQYTVLLAMMGQHHNGLSLAYCILLCLLCTSTMYVLRTTTSVLHRDIYDIPTMFNYTRTTVLISKLSTADVTTAHE